MISTAEDICPRAQDALRSSPIFALRELSVQLRGNQLLMQGTVASFYHKQLAQEVVLAVSSGVEIVNSIEVRDYVRAID